MPEGKLFNFDPVQWVFFQHITLLKCQRTVDCTIVKEMLLHLNMSVMKIANPSPWVPSSLFLGVINTGIHGFLLLLSSVSGFIFEHSSTKSVRFESGLRDLLLQHIPHILQFSSGVWDDQQSFWSESGNRGSLGTVGCTQHPTSDWQLMTPACYTVATVILQFSDQYWDLWAFTKHLDLMWAILLEKSAWIHNQTVTVPHDRKTHLNHCNSHELCKHYSFYVKHVKSRNGCILHYLRASWIFQGGGTGRSCENHMSMTITRGDSLHVLLAHSHIFRMLRKRML